MRGRADEHELRRIGFLLSQSIETAIPSATTNPPEIRWRARRRIRTEYER